MLLTCNPFRQQLAIPKPRKHKMIVAAKKMSSVKL